LELIKNTKINRTVIFCLTKKRTEQLSNFINENIENKCLYHNSDLSLEQKKQVTHKWLNGEI
jgi:superfamily II DNA helicase RecQ